MTQEEINRGETDTLEFKRELPKGDRKWLRTVAAFSNGQGGRLVFGVENESLAIVGVPDDQVRSLQDRIVDTICTNVAPLVIPFVSCETIADRTLLVFDIPAGRRTPYYLKSEGPLDGIYIRIGATTRKADPDKVRELFLYGQGRTYDAFFEKGTELMSDSVSFLCQEIERRSGNLGFAVGKEQLLGWNLLRERKGRTEASVAFRLLAQNNLLNARIQCGLFRGTEKVDFLDQRVCEGPVQNQIDEAERFVMRSVRIGARIDGFVREDVPELPRAAVRELIVNAVAHRNYLIQSCIQVSVFDDRLEVFSPGGLYGGLTMEQMLSGVSRRRNPLLADVLRRMRIVENWGTGMRQVQEACRAAHLRDPEIEIVGDNVRATIRRPTPDEWVGIVTGKAALPSVSTRRNRTSKTPARPGPHGPDAVRRTVMDILRTEPGISRKDLCDRTGRSASTIARAVAELIRSGELERRGSDRAGGYWPAPATGTW